MRVYIVIPAYNEEQHIEATLKSLALQTVKADKIIVVNDNSSDRTEELATAFASRYDNMSCHTHLSEPGHQPGSKVIEAFYAGLDQLDGNFDLICKFDADVIFPANYLETMIEMFSSDRHLGMAGGLLHIFKNGQWIYETVASREHVRGPIKMYRKPCFEAMDGLRPSVGWDTLDVLLAQYHGWSVRTNESLIVKHLKPTGSVYKQAHAQLYGRALYVMRAGCFVTVVAALKRSVITRSLGVFFGDFQGYFKALIKGEKHITTREEGRFIRRYRRRSMVSKLLQ